MSQTSSYYCPYLGEIGGPCVSTKGNECKTDADCPTGSNMTCQTLPVWKTWNDCTWSSENCTAGLEKKDTPVVTPSGNMKVCVMNS